MGLGIILAFAPFIVFALGGRFIGSTNSLAAGAVVALVLCAYTAFVQKKGVRILEGGTAILFCALTIYALVANPNWPVFEVRLIVDAGLFVVIAGSIVIRQPFTLQYARDRVPKEHWSSPQFLRVNDAITGAWAVAFALIVICDGAVVLWPSIPGVLAFGVILVVVYGAYRFTVWYPRAAASR